MLEVIGKLNRYAVFTALAITLLLVILPAPKATAGENYGLLARPILFIAVVLLALFSMPIQFIVLHQARKQPKSEARQAQEDSILSTVGLAFLILMIVCWHAFIR